MRLLQGIRLALLLGVIIFFAACAPESNSQQSTTPQEAYEPPFTKEGTLTIWEADGVTRIKDIDIEFSRTSKEIMDGMMFRKSMADTAGMFFIMPREEPQSFWMNNCYISLDIVYINSDQEIVSIAANAQPMSKESLPSGRPAKFVLEVNGGFCEKYGVASGNFITYNPL
ncbi:MAG: DUF192 domain-containing protein [Bacteroidota bacterium]